MCIRDSAITAGGAHACAILDDGSVSCWGNNEYGKLGDGTSTDRNTPSQTSSLGIDRTAVVIDVRDYHTCVILDDGSVSCWGVGFYGALGGGVNSDRNTPTQTSSLGIGRTAAFSNYDDVFHPATGQTSQVACPVGSWQPDTGQTSCDDAESGYYVDSTGQSTQIACEVGTWQADTGQTSCDDAEAGYYVDTTGQSTQIAAEIGHYVDTTGQSTQTVCEVGTWQADTGQISCDDAEAGHYVDSTGQSTQIACGAGTYNPNTGSIASSDCLDAEAGYYVVDDSWTESVHNGFEQTISAGRYHTCAILDDGSVSCWGLNGNGQLGDGTTTGRNTPTQTSSLGTDRTPVAITAGGYHTCAILDDGSVSCWGYNGYGRLGDGTTTDRNTPTAIEIE